MSLAKRLLLAGAIALACSQPVLAETVGQTLEQADRYWVEGKLVQAQQAFEAAVKAEPASVPARLRLAGFQLSQQQMEACIANYKQVIGQEPKNSKAWIGLGMAFLHISQPENARAHLTKRFAPIRHARSSWRSCWPNWTKKPSNKLCDESKKAPESGAFFR